MAWRSSLAVLLFAVLAWLRGGMLLAGSETTGSDVGEHFRLLLSLEHPGWPGWGANRYPLPALLAHGACFADDAHGCWARAAALSMVGTGAGLFLWGRALVGPAAGVVALVLALAVDDVVGMSRTVTGYPVMLALWTLAAGLAANAMRWPTLGSCLLAGIGAGLVFASDARGLLVGLAVTAAGTAAVLGCRRSVVLGALALALPVAVSWGAYHALPMRLSPLESLVETTVEVSWTRAGLSPPERRVTPPHAWIWGRSTPLDLPGVAADLREAHERMNPAVHPEQRVALARAMPLHVAFAILSAGLLLRPGRIALLLPGLGMAAVYAATMSMEYHARYAALGAPVLVVAAAGGLATWGGRLGGWPSVPVAVLLVALPGALCAWDGAGTLTAPPELRACLARLRGGVPEVDNVSVRECVETGDDVLSGRLSSPSPR